MGSTKATGSTQYDNTNRHGVDQQRVMMLFIDFGLTDWYTD